MNMSTNFLKIFFNAFVSTAMAIICAILIVVLYTNAQLPPVNDLEDIQLQVPLRIYTADGKLIGEFGEKKRTPIKIDQVPEKLKQAILATEDRRFYEHNGVDIRGMMRAAINLAVSGTKSQGASTITMQVARNFFLTRKKTFWRKLNEVLLAVKIEQNMTKDQILELYLNKIYFGKRAYGVQAAAQTYYGVNVDELNLAQIAMLAGLPQAPSSINPISHPEAALKRRTHVLKRMLHYGFITAKEFENAVNFPIATHYHGTIVEAHAPYVAEMARQELVEKLGPDVYTAGLSAYTTVNSHLQEQANKALQAGLMDYEKRHRMGTPVAHFKLDRGNIDEQQWVERLNNLPKTSLCTPAAIVRLGYDIATVLLPNGQKVNLSLGEMADLNLQVGDVIYAQPSENEGETTWIATLYPKVEGALVALYPKNGAILAMVGGFNFSTSSFNRVTQATLQPGSNFKPFIYAAAFEHGFTPATIINDAPVVFKDPHLDEVWRPQNDNRKFYGPTRLRVGLTKSRNLVSIRLLQALGIKRAIKTISRFGFQTSKMPYGLSLALGTASATPLEVATGYAAFANGGYKINPFIIQHVYDSHKNIVFEAAPTYACPECDFLEEEGIDPEPVQENVIDKMASFSSTQIKAPAERAIEPQTAYIMTSILQDVIQSGTATKAKELHRSDLAGKTGTTNNQMDAWYTGYNTSLVATVWVGYDEPKSLDEYGSQAALPIWMKFMGAALKDVPEKQPVQPRGLITVKIDPVTGHLARPDQPNAVFEIFRQETVPTQTARPQHEDDSDAITPSGSNGDSLF